MSASAGVSTVSTARSLRAPGLFALACFTAHAIYHVARHETHDLLWTCNLACLVVAPPRQLP